MPRTSILVFPTRTGPAGSGLLPVNYADRYSSSVDKPQTMASFPKRRHYLANRRESMLFRASFAAAVAFTFIPGWLHAQTFRGAIQGTVFDSSGSAVSNAEVTATGDQTRLARHVVTD